MLESLYSTFVEQACRFASHTVRDPFVSPGCRCRASSRERVYGGWRGRCAAWDSSSACLQCCVECGAFGHSHSVLHAHNGAWSSSLLLYTEGDPSTRVKIV
jgi:hypothetical protein